MYTALFYDGVVLKGYAVGVELLEEKIRIVPNKQLGSASAPLQLREWMYEDLNLVGNPMDGPPVRLSHIKESDMRLEIHDLKCWHAISSRLKQRKVRHGIYLPAHSGLIAVSSVFAVLIILAVYFGGAYLSSWIAPLVPSSTKTAIADTAYQQLFSGSSECYSPEGNAALAKLHRRLQSASGLRDVPPFTVVKKRAMNAVTLPDNRVIVFSGLLHSAESPEELAGVLAHELGHIRHNHPSELLVRVFGGRLLLLFMLGNSSALVDGTQIAPLLLHMRHVQKKEREADLAAQDILMVAGISSKGLLTFFSRLQREGADDSILRYLSTHPSSHSRIQLLEAKNEGSAGQDNLLPPLSSAEWQALQEICGK